MRGKANSVVDGFLKKVDELCDQAVGDFRQQRRRVVNFIMSQLQTWNDYEPYTKTVEGFFVDDYVVDYNKVLRWYFPSEAAKSLDEAARAEAADSVKEWIDGCYSALNAFSRILEGVNQEFEKAGITSLGDPGRFPQYSSRQTVMLERDFLLFIRSRDWYFFGGMQCGGLYALSRILFAERYDTRPGLDQIEGLVDWLLPIGDMVGMIQDHDSLAEWIRNSTMECYDSMEQDLNQTSQAIQEQQATLTRVLAGLSRPGG